MAMGQGRAGRGGAKGWGLRPRPAWFFLAPSQPCPALHDRENFLIPSPPLGGPAPPHPVKLYFLLIFPITKTIFFNKTYFINKNILEITTKFIPSNQINF